MSESSTEQFVRLLVANEHSLYCYAFSLLGKSEDAKDVTQEAAIAMWQQFGNFDPTRPFWPWATRFVYLTAANFRRKRRQNLVAISDEVLDAIAEDAASAPSSAQLRLEAITGCLDKLPARARTLMNKRYQHNQSIKEIADRDGVNLNTLYKAFEKIRAALHECVERALLDQEPA